MFLLKFLNFFSILDNCDQSATAVEKNAGTGRGLYIRKYVIGDIPRFFKSVQALSYLEKTYNCTQFLFRFYVYASTILQTITTYV